MQKQTFVSPRMSPSEFPKMSDEPVTRGPVQLGRSSQSSNLTGAVSFHHLSGLPLPLEQLFALSFCLAHLVQPPGKSDFWRPERQEDTKNVLFCLFKL